ncbi:MAG: hypothetical protein ACOYVJ_07720 [Nitrospirota bacterium]
MAAAGRDRPTGAQGITGLKEKTCQRANVETLQRHGGSPLANPR